MRLLSRSLPSFSLIEMLVVMVLSSIIVGIIYFSYYTLYTYQVSLSKRYKGFEDISTLYFQLKTDVDRCDRVDASDGNTLRFKIPKPDTEIHYFFSTSYVAREQAGRIDTFYCRLQNPVFMLKGNSLADRSAQVDEIQIGVGQLPVEVNVHIYKQYDVASLLETVQKDTMP